MSFKKLMPTNFAKKKVLSLSFDFERFIIPIIQGKKTTDIRLFSKKWEKYYQYPYNITLRFYWRQKSKYNFVFYETELFELLILDIKNNSLLSEEIKLAGYDSIEELYHKLERKYGKDFLNYKYVRIMWKKKEFRRTKPNETNIDWFDKSNEKLFTINPLVINSKLYQNCFFNCIYCYEQPVFAWLNSQFKKGYYEDRINGLNYAKQNVFIESISDLFHSKIPSNFQRYMINKINKENVNKCRIFFLTKNPMRYRVLKKVLNPELNYIGITLESNSYKYQSHEITKAMRVEKRAEIFKHINYPLKFVSIEPILKFDNELISLIKEINPKIVFIGANSRKNINGVLNEPSGKEIEELIKELKKSNINVIQKKNLSRIYNNTSIPEQKSLLQFIKQST